MVKCPECGYEAENIFKFCPICGHNLTAGSPTLNAANSTLTDRTETSETHKFYKVVNGIFEYPKAPVGRRFAAYLIDALIIFLLSIPSLVLFIAGYFMNSDHGSFDNEDISGVSILGGMMALWGLFLLIIPLIYYFIKDGLKNGQSFGKKIMKLMVIDTLKNKPCSIGKSAFRNFISSLIVSIPFLNILTVWIEPIMVLARNDGRKAADFVASTQVIDFNHFEKT